MPTTTASHHIIMSVYTNFHVINMDSSLLNDSEYMRLARGAMGLPYDCHGTANIIAEKSQSVRHVHSDHERMGTAA